MAPHKFLSSIFLKKLILPILLVFITSKQSLAQRNDWRSRIDEKVQLADSLSLKSQKVFYLNKFIGTDRPVKETWYYTMNKGKLVIFEVKYVLDSAEYSEIYYTDKGSLICMEQYEVPYLSVYTDEVKKGAAYFFDNDYVRQYVITGKMSLNDRNSSYSLLSRFEKRMAELKETLTLQK